MKFTDIRRRSKITLRQMIIWSFAMIFCHAAFSLGNNFKETNLLYTAHTSENHGGGAISTSIVEDQEGSLFITNESGLLKFDGKNWRQMPSTGQTNYLSSVAIDPSNRIWISGLNYIGYYTLDNEGDYLYSDLTNTIYDQLNNPELGTFWKIYAQNDDIYLITSKHALRWNGKIWKLWHFNDQRRILTSWISNKLYVHDRGTGLFRLDGEDFTLIAEDTPAVAPGIISIIENTDNGLLCATLSDGFYFLKDRNFTSADIKWGASQIVHANRLKNGTIAVSTVQDGILIVDKKGELIGHAHHDKNPIYYSIEHSSGSIWAATPSTIIEIQNVALSCYSDKALDIVEHQQKVYYTNGNALKVINQQTESEWSPKQVATGVATWDLYSAEHDLLYGGSEAFGVMKSHTESYTINSTRHIGYLFESQKDKSIVYTSDAPQVSRWHRTTSGWEYLDSLNDFNAGALSLVELPNSKLLISTENSPLFFVDWQANQTITRLGEAQGLPDKFIWAYCLRAGEHVVIITDKGLFSYNNDTELFHYDSALGNNLGTDAYALESCPAANGNGWILHLSISGHKNQIGNLMIDSEGQFRWLPFQLPSANAAGKVESLLHQETTESSEILWVVGSNKLLRYDLGRLPSHPAPKTRLTSISEQETNQVYFNGKGTPTEKLTWEYPQKGLIVEFVAPPSPIRIEAYQTRLVGFNSSWTKPNNATYREFTNLSHGDYTFQVQAIDEFGRTGEIAAFSFTIRTPWYLTPIAYIGYVIAAIIILFLSNYWRNRTLRINNEQLESLVNTRTHELEEQKLKLIRANRAKQNFLASMSHEIRNPLNGIVGIAQLLYSKEKKQGQQSEQITHLNTCSKHLHQLISQTLDYSSLEAGKIRARTESFDPSALLNEVIQIQAEMAQAKGIELSLEQPAIKYQWEGDPVFLRQILINLISNGIKYTPTGSVKLSLTYQMNEDSIDSCFEVIDTGPGIPKDKQTLIFEQFTRLPESEQSQIPGTGLGLAISSEMAQLMGGKLELDGDYQGGSRFLLCVEFGIDRFSFSKEKATDSKDLQALEGKRVLIVDDMDFNRYVSVEVLLSMGAEIDQAENGLVALEMLQNTTYDIAILDINMPKMSGPEAVKRFLQLDNNEPAPEFIALSAYNTPEMEEKCIAAGFKHFIEKPLAPSKLEQLLKQHHGKAPPLKDSNTSLLSYLSKNGSKSFETLYQDYKKSFKKELDNLQIALIQDNHKQQRDVIHKLLGLCRVNNDDKISELTDTLSAQSKQGASKEDISSLIKQLSTQLEQEPKH